MIIMWKHAMLNVFFKRLKFCTWYLVLIIIFKAREWSCSLVRPHTAQLTACWKLQGGLGNIARQFSAVRQCHGCLIDVREWNGEENKNRNSLFLSVISHNINNMQTRAVPQLGAVLEKGGDFFSTVDFLWIRTFGERVEKRSERGPDNADRLKKRSRMRHWKDSLEGLTNSC